jgi:hypothetical protein
MRHDEDFDIIQDDEIAGGRSPNWRWFAIVAVVAVFAFGVGAAFVMVARRYTPPEVLPTVVLPTSPVQSTLTVPVAAQTTPVLTLPLTSTAGIPTTPVQALTSTVTPIVADLCPQSAEEVLVPVYDRQQFGCARGPAAVVWAAWQPFERGSMLWRSDTDAAYVFTGDGRWYPVPAAWDGSPAADRGQPPANLQAPVRGFGYVWGQSDELFSELGWATDNEKGFCAAVQNFERGFILRSSSVPSCASETLYNHATSADWSPLLLAATDDGRWRSQPAGSTPARSVDGSPEATLTRPGSHGLYEAHRLDGFVLDGQFGDWDGAWFPINAVVHGAENLAGPGDLSASFQVGYLATGLALAVRVNDEALRTGPAGTDQWQGDGLEVQFDRDLAVDFADTQASADDYQVGLSFDPGTGQVYAYRWLPYAEEGRIDLPAAVEPALQGYSVEAVIPWSVFGLDSESLSAGVPFGFNIAVNDNDGELPAQQTIISASAARTTHDNPSEWATLRFLP